MPRSDSCLSAPGSPGTSAIGTYSTAPADALATVGVTCTERCRGSRTPVTPAPSQLRMMAPRLPGSVTPSTATRNGGTARRRPSTNSRLRGRPRGSRPLWRAHPAAPRFAPPVRACDSERRTAAAPGGHAAISTMSATPGIAFELCTDPHLVHLAALGHQQLTYRLTALDLATSEALGPTGAAAARLRPARFRPACRPRPRPARSTSTARPVEPGRPDDFEGG